MISDALTPDSHEARLYRTAPVVEEVLSLLQVKVGWRVVIERDDLVVDELRDLE